MTTSSWKVMMEERKQGKEPSSPVEFDQEALVTDKEGRVVDTSMMKYRPVYEGRWQPRRQSSTGRTNPIMT